jgi:hypothetical protein
VSVTTEHISLTFSPKITLIFVLSDEEQVRKNGMNERPVLSHTQVEVLSNYVHTWPQRLSFSRSSWCFVYKKLL